MRSPTAGVGGQWPPAGSNQQPTPQNAWIPPDSVPTRLILVRHGVTVDTIARRFAGRSDPELAPEGVEQANRVAERVGALGPVDVVLSSPLRRAMQTAGAVAARLGLPVQPAQGFAETDFGDWDGSTFAEVRERWPAEYTDWLGASSVAPPGGESFDDVALRVVRARDEVLATHGARTVVVVSHVTPIKLLVRLALDAPSTALHRMFLSPASVSVIDYFADGPVTLRSFNDSAHLDVAKSDAINAGSAAPRPARAP